MVRYLKTRAEGYVRPCVMIVITCMLLSVFITFAEAVSVVKQTERNSRVVLDNYVMLNSIQIYNSIKTGNDKNPYLDSASYTDSLADFCTFAEEGGYLYNYDRDGNVLFYLSQPVMEYVKDNTLKISVRYTVFVPIRFAGLRVDTAEIPITVTSKFTEKF